MKPSSLLILLVALVGACSSLVGDTPTDSENTVDTRDADPAPTTTEQCLRFTGGTNPVDTGSLAGDALHVVGEAFICAPVAVVVDIEDIVEVSAAAQLASALNVPLLHPHPQLPSELGRLRTTTAYVVGTAELLAPGGTELKQLTAPEALEIARSTLGVESSPGGSAADLVTNVASTVEALIGRSSVYSPPSSVPKDSVDVAGLVEALAKPTESEIIWLVTAKEPARIISMAANGRTVGATTMAYDPEDLLGYPTLGEALSGRPIDAIRFVGTAPEASEWEVRLLTGASQLPGGGYFVFPDDQPRRYVAFYGHPETRALGVLGEQGPEETLARMAPFVESYKADGSLTIPTFEMIASVASAAATDDGDYSFEWDPATFQPWIDVATTADGYVILDLQSGREDFLTQAKQYEELLLQPNVGLALDPEWRLKPDQVHLRQVGRVEAAEVNMVVDWLADLVRDNGLPQKMIIVHQFRTEMIQNRSALKERAELAMVIQMDGQGPIGTKDETYAVLTSNTEGVHWKWGWKNFFDEDTPTPSPSHTMGKNPVPLFVSYQ